MNKGPLMPPNASRAGSTPATEIHAGVAAGTPLENLSFSSPFDEKAAQPTSIHTAASVKDRFGGVVTIGETTIRVELAA